jgi:hypothetical protein
MGRAPYAPSTAILSIVAQHRKTPIAKFDPVVLDRQVGVPESLIPRTLVALQLLGFSDESGNATSEFTALARVPEAQVPDALASLLQTAYEPVIATLGGDLSATTPDEVEAAFRSYNPLGQVDRMAQLFTGLMIYVGLMPETARRRSSGSPDSKRERLNAGAVFVKARTEKPSSPVSTKTPDKEASPADAYSRTVELEGGAGTITLSGTVNIFGLKGKSRDFVFGLIDLIDDYEIVFGERGAVEDSRPKQRP